MAPTILLLDIEGTTTSISFVKDTLFPYILKTLLEYLNNNWNSKLLNEDIELLKSDALNEHKNGNLEIPLIPDKLINNDEEIKQAIIKNIEYQMKIDRKSYSLKSIQGHIWKKGYEDGNLQGHVFQDVPIAFKRWSESGLCQIYIYSSGSVEAQKLLFKHTIYGNLLTYISGHFDTKIGSKIDSLSYTNILKELNISKENVLFLTDVIKEAKASNLAGIESVLVIRPGNHPIESNELKMFKSINTFDELDEIYFKKDKK